MTCVLVGGVWLPVSVVVWAMWRACDMDRFELLQAVGSVIWNQKLVFENVAFRDLPTATRVVFNVYTKEGPAGWAGLNLFTYQRELKMGAIVLKMWPGECTADMVGTRRRRVRSVQLLAADTRHQRTLSLCAGGRVHVNEQSRRRRGDYWRVDHQSAPDEGVSRRCRCWR